MTEAERAYQRQVDEIILAATGKELAELQLLDVESQLNGGTFYDSYSTMCRRQAVQSREPRRRR